MSLVDVLAAVTVVASVLAISVPVIAKVSSTTRATTAARGLQSWMRLARVRAAATGATSGVVFDLHGGKWRARRCADGNGDGLKRADVAAGLDPCEGLGEPFAALWPDAEIAVDAGIPGPDGGAASADPVRFGAGDVAGFTARGTAVSGTVFVRSSAGHQFAIRVAGQTGRIRLLRYDSASGRWLE